MVGHHALDVGILVRSQAPQPPRICQRVGSRPASLGDQIIRINGLKNQLAILKLKIKENFNTLIKWPKIGLFCWFFYIY